MGGSIWFGNPTVPQGTCRSLCVSPRAAISHRGGRIWACGTPAARSWRSCSAQGQHSHSPAHVYVYVCAGLCVFLRSAQGRHSHLPAYVCACMCVCVSVLGTGPAQPLARAHVCMCVRANVCFLLSDRASTAAHLQVGRIGTRNTVHCGRACAHMCARVCTCIGSSPSEPHHQTPNYIQDL